MATTTNPHYNLESMKLVALDAARQYDCKYTIIICNPDDNGKFSASAGSTYEMVQDSYFEKERPNITVVTDTDKLLTEAVTNK